MPIMGSTRINACTISSLPVVTHVAHTVYCRLSPRERAEAENIGMYVCMDVWMYGCMNVYMYVWMYVWMYV